MKILFILLVVALVLPLATAFDCTELEDEEYEMCLYIEDTNWSQSEKDEFIQDMIDNEGNFNGDFESILDQEVEIIQLNGVSEEDLTIDEENKKFLFDLSSISIFGYFIYALLKKFYLLSTFL